MFFILVYFQNGFMGLWGERVDAIEYYKEQIKALDKRVSFNCFFSQSTCINNIVDGDLK